MGVSCCCSRFRSGESLRVFDFHSRTRRPSLLWLGAPSQSSDGTTQVGIDTVFGSYYRAMYEIIAETTSPLPSLIHMVGSISLN